MGAVTDSELSRRDVLKLGAGAVAVAGALSVVRSLPAAAAPSNLNEMTVAQMQAAMASNQLSSLDLVNYYIARIKTLDQAGPTVNSVIEVNPDAKAIAQSLDAERKSGHVRGPLHGIPVLLKDNVGTGDKMQTAAGSLGLVGSPAAHDSAVAANLRAAGAVILGKTTLSEWANFRSFFSTSGWSGRGGQCNNPYALDRNACGSSSGSGAAASANFSAVSIGSETDGSIVCPASMNGVVGIKPTVGLTSRGGVVPISHTQDTVGPHTRTVADAAAVLTAIAQRTPDPLDPATSTNRNLIPADYTKFLNANGLSGARIGVARDFEGFSPHADAAFEDSLTAMSKAGATLVDVSFPHIDDINKGFAEFTVLLFDFKADLQKYFATRTGVPLAGGNLQTAIDFDNANAAKEMPFFAQEIFDLAETFDITSTSVVQPLGMSYDQAIAFDKLIGATEGIDKLLTDNNLDAIVAPTDSPAFPTDLINADHFIFGSSSPCAIVGYPIINVPMGMTFGVPVGISFMGTAFSEPKLIALASGFEAVTHARQQPMFLATLPFNTKGEPTHVKQRRVLPARVAPSHI
ncbi:MAG: amidase [Chloroflexi bacterium]|nr:MAG: amidase [Chloroflexota bacterium]